MPYGRAQKTSFLKLPRREPFGVNLSAWIFRREPFGLNLSARTFRFGAKLLARSFGAELSARVSEKTREKSTCHFLVNLADRPRNFANLITIRPNPGTIG